MTIKQISATELKLRLDRQEALLLLDVREPFEFHYARIDGSLLMPLHQIPERFRELDPMQSIVVICHHGIRSQQAARFLVQSGLINIGNLAGGIDAWSRDCDHSVPRY